MALRFEAIIIGKLFLSSVAKMHMKVTLAIPQLLREAVTSSS